MSIQEEIQNLQQSSEIVLFILDTRKYPGGTIHRFHSGTNQLNGPVVWQGETYQAWPIEAEGFDLSSKGVLPRPRMKVANANGIFSQEVVTFDDLVGCTITRKRTRAKFLDAVNFPDGVNPDADPNQFLPDDLWYVESKVSENRYMIEFELSSAFDLQDVQLPSREVIQNSCTWDYRSAECGYTGFDYFDANDQPCDQASDFCAKRLTSCKARFGVEIIPYGAFPGSTRYG